MNTVSDSPESTRQWPSSSVELSTEKRPSWTTVSEMFDSSHLKVTPTRN